MLHLSQTIASLKQAIVRSGSKRHDEMLPEIESAYIVRSTVQSANGLIIMDPKVFPCLVTSAGVMKCTLGPPTCLSKPNTDSQPYSTPISSASPSIFSRDNSSTSTVVTIPSPSIPELFISDYDAEKAGIPSEIEWEYQEMLFGKVEGGIKVRQLSASNIDTIAARKDPMTFGYLAPPGALPVLERKQRVIPRRVTKLRV